MSYVESSYKRPAWIGIVVALVLVYWFVSPGLRGMNDRARLSTPEGFEAEALRDGDIGPLIVAMKEGDPAEMNRFFAQGADRIRAGATSEQMTQFNQQFMAAAQRRRAERLALAPNAALVAITQKQAALLELLHTKDPELCGTLTAKGPESVKGMDSEVLRQLADLTRTQWRTAAVEPAPESKKGASITRDDALALTAIMRRNGLSEANARQFETLATLTNLPVTSQCEISYHSYRAMLMLPEPRRDRVMRWMYGPA